LKTPKLLKRSKDFEAHQIEVERYLRMLRQDIADAIAESGAFEDHGALAGLSDDDHTQYLLATGARACLGIFSTAGLISTQNASLLDFLILPKTAGKGIKVDTTTPTFGFRDLLGEVTQKNTGATKPTDAVFRGGIRGYRFEVGDEERFEYHIPHDHVPGTDIFIHLHWSHNSAIVTGGNMVFGYEVTYAKGHGQQAYPAPVFGTITGNASTTQYMHSLDEIQLSASTPSGSQINTGDIEPDGIIKLRIDVQENNITSSGVVPDPFIDYVDIHYQSSNIATKNKSPNFYA
jgi:hypothetical protein